MIGYSGRGKVAFGIEKAWMHQRRVEVIKHFFRRFSSVFFHNLHSRNKQVKGQRRKFEGKSLPKTGMLYASVWLESTENASEKRAKKWKTNILCVIMKVEGKNNTLSTCTGKF